jgi:hypothetical protein
LNNPELIKTIAFDLEFDRDVEESDIKLEISTLSKSGAQIKRGELVYKSKKKKKFVASYTIRDLNHNQMTH